MRRAVTTQAGTAVTAIPIKASAKEMDPSQDRGARYLWAALLARIYEALPLVCPHCGAQMRLIAAITDQPSISRILTHIGESEKPPPITPARGPPQWEWGFDQRTLTDDVEPIPDYEFDQRIIW